MQLCISLFEKKHMPPPLPVVIFDVGGPNIIYSNDLIFPFSLT